MEIIASCFVAKTGTKRRNKSSINKKAPFIGAFLLIPHSTRFLTFVKKINFMASRKYLKKNLNNMIFDIVEECFTIQILDDSKVAQADAIIDEAASFQDMILERINAAKTKADFRPITQEIEDAAISFINKLNGLN